MYPYTHIMRLPSSMQVRSTIVAHSPYENATIGFDDIPGFVERMPRMDTLTIRDLRNRPGAAQADLATKGELLLTSNGRPVALMLAVDGSTLDETVQALHLARAQLALRALRKQARDQGTSALPLSDIDAEIDESRRARR
jgi:hypothetical protein